MPAEVGVGSVSTVFTYFNPTRSPYYTIGVAACIGLYYSCTVTRDSLWLWLSIPAYLVAALTLILSIDSGNNLTIEEHEDQLRFARSTCISVAVLALVFAGREIATGDQPAQPLTQNEYHNFKINIIICCVQIIVFLVYNWGLNKQGLPVADRNYVQITLLTSAFLADTSINMAVARGGDQGEPGHHQMVAYGLGTLWALCIVFWITKLIQLRIVQIQIQRLEPGARPIRAGAAAGAEDVRGEPH
jgi:hypothetical protein